MIVPSEKEIREAAERNSGRFRMNATIGSRQAVVDRCILRDWDLSEESFLACAEWFASKLREPGAGDVEAATKYGETKVFPTPSTRDFLAGCIHTRAQAQEELVAYRSALEKIADPERKHGKVSGVIAREVLARFPRKEGL